MLQQNLRGKLSLLKTFILAEVGIELMILTELYFFRLDEEDKSMINQHP